MKKLVFILCASGLVSLAGGAMAEEPVAAFSFNAGVTSDYVWRGISQTDGNAAVQGGVDFTYGGFYAGGWASTVDFGDSTDFEWDLTAGVTGTAGAIDWDLGLAYYAYAGAPSGADYDFVELKAAASHSFEKLTLGALVYYSPDFSGVDETATYLEANGAYEINDRWSVSGGVGRQFLDVTSDYTAWNLGVGVNLTKALSLDVRYWDASYSSALTDARLSATLGAAF
ncbi:TorF family putative porin [Brevundimonas sp.]|uniref:TorF family putative porin n=2 Tax=Brevundimonas sp. TaxID=1871086 RepID=UPI002FC9B8E9